MSPQGLIQAFSRTNRIFKKIKDYGNVITFQTPAIFKHAIDEALQLYSNGGETCVIAPSYSIVKQGLVDNYSSLLTLINESPATIDISGSSDEFLKNFIKKFQEMDKSVKAINTYEEWEKDNDAGKETDDNGDNLVIFKVNGLTLTKETQDTLIGKYNSAIEELKRRVTGPAPESLEDIDITYKLELISKDEVNYEYLVSLIQKYINAYGDSEKFKAIHDPAIDKYIENLSKKNNKLGEILFGVWNELKANPENFKGKQAMVVINERINKIIDDKLSAFCDEWCVEKTDMWHYSKFFNGEGELEISNMEKFCYIDKYKETHPTAMKLIYYKQVREMARTLIVDEIKPLLI